MITIYVLQSIESQKRYVGITNNLNRRLKEHRSKNATIYRILRDFEVIYTEQCMDYKSARLREKYLKSGKGRDWLNNNPGRDLP